MEKQDYFKCKSALHCPEHEYECESIDGFKCIHIGDCSCCDQDKRRCTECKYNKGVRL